MKEKCVPEGQQNKVKEDKEMNKVKEANDLVDVVFDNPSEFKKANMVKEADGLVDIILDNCGKKHGVEEVENKIENAPTEDPAEDAERVKGDIAGKPDEESAMDGATDMIEMFMMKEEMNDYQKFVQAKLKASGFSTPAKMPPDKRKAFFSSLSKEWKAKKGA